MSTMKKKSRTVLGGRGAEGYVQEVEEDLKRVVKGTRRMRRRRTRWKTPKRTKRRG